MILVRGEPPQCLQQSSLRSPAMKVERGESASGGTSASARLGDGTILATPSSTSEQTIGAAVESDKPTKRRVSQKAKQTDTAKAERIDDFGEKLEGACKDYASKMQAARDVDIATESLAKSWPEPDYQKMLDNAPGEAGRSHRHATDQNPYRGLLRRCDPGHHPIIGDRSLQGVMPSVRKCLRRIHQTGAQPSPSWRMLKQGSRLRNRVKSRVQNGLANSKFQELRGCEAPIIGLTSE